MEMLILMKTLTEVKIEENKDEDDFISQGSGVYNPDFAPPTEPATAVADGVAYVISDMDFTDDGELMFLLVDIDNVRLKQWVPASKILVVNDIWECIDWTGSGIVFNVSVGDKILCLHPDKMPHKRGPTAIRWSTTYYWATVVDVKYSI